MQPIASDTSLMLASRLISIAYPLADVLLLAVLARLFTSPGARSASYRLLGAALLLQLGADIVFAGLTAVGTYSGGFLDLGWMASYLCWGAAALHPSVRSLSEVAPARGVRVNRLLARYGGEEFAALLAGCSLGDAIGILDRVRQATPLGETVSIGVVHWDGQQSPEQLFRAADDALYQAKHEGRDRVVARPAPRPGGDRVATPAPA